MRVLDHLTSVAGERLSGALGVLTSVAVLVLGLSPTGSFGTDAVVIVATVTAAVWFGSFAPWWAAVALGCVAIAIAGIWWAPIGGLICVMLALVARFNPTLRQPATALSVAAGVLALSGGRELGWFGMSSVVAVVVVTAAASTGLLRLPPNRRRRASIGVAVAAGVCVIAALGLVVAALGARSELTDGRAAADRGLDLIRSGEFEDARAEFAAAAVDFRRADVTLRRPWAQASRLIPVLAQHRSAGEGLANAAAAASRLLDAELRALDLDALRVVDGRIDVEAVRDLQEPLDRVNRTIERLEKAVSSERSAWLVPRVQSVLDDLTVELADQRALGNKAAEALEVAPAILGEEGARRYFVMFTTPAEARGLGGFMGNYAELTVDDGRITLTGFGRHSDLTAAGGDDRRIDDAPDDWLARYGTFGFTTGPGGTTGTAPWANITMSPHFPSTAQVVAELYPQSGGRRIDGVFSLDVFALQELVGLVGPIDLAGAPMALDGSNTANFLLVGQYKIDDAEQRTDLLEAVARSTLRRLLGGSAPDPLDLGRALAPRVRQRRMMGWSRFADEQAMFTRVGFDGALLGDLDGADGIAVTVDNASGNKIDTFLGREFELTDNAESPGTYELRIRLRNDPPLDLPDYVVGNLVNLPRGSSRLFVSVHTTMRLVSARGPGGLVGLQPSTESGFPVYSSYVDIPAGAVIEWRLTLESTDPLRRFGFVPQPLVTPPRVLLRTEEADCDLRPSTLLWINLRHRLTTEVGSEPRSRPCSLTDRPPAN